MGIKSELIKNIIIDFFDILMACINLVNIYLTLFSNKRQFLSSITNMLAIFTTISSYLTVFLNYFLFISPNFINLNSL